MSIVNISFIVRFDKRIVSRMPVSAISAGCLATASAVARRTVLPPSVGMSAATSAKAIGLVVVKAPPFTAAAHFPGLTAASPGGILFTEGKSAVMCVF